MTLEIAGVCLLTCVHFSNFVDKPAICLHLVLSVFVCLPVRPSVRISV